MNNEELKKKIADIVLGVEWTGCLGNTYHISGGMSVANAIADALIEAGYRKQSEVVKEFVKKLKERDVWCWEKYGEGIGHTDIDELAAEFGAEDKQ